jgi:hypothetical protein
MQRQPPAIEAMLSYSHVLSRLSCLLPLSCPLTFKSFVRWGIFKNFFFFSVGFASLFAATHFLPLK